MTLFLHLKIYGKSNGNILFGVLGPKGTMAVEAFTNLETVKALTMCDTIFPLQI